MSGIFPNRVEICAVKMNYMYNSRLNLFYTVAGLIALNFGLYLLFPMAGYRRWDGLMTATVLSDFGGTPWNVIFYFAHTLVIPITKLFHLSMPSADPLLIATIRETFFSSLNVTLIYLFFRRYLKGEMPALLLGIIYIFCNAHWQFASGGEEKDTMLFFNLIYLIGLMEVKGWTEFGWLNRLRPVRSSKHVLGRYLPEIFLGIVLALSFMIHLQNGILVLTTAGIWVARKSFYRNFKKEVLQLAFIFGTAGLLVLVWYGFLIIHINQISTIQGAMEWLFEYHHSGEFFNAKIGFFDQYTGAYSGFRSFIIGEQFNHDELWVEAILVTMFFITMSIYSLKRTPIIAGVALIYIGITTAHFFFWLPWDPEQWNPVVFTGFIILSPSIFLINRRAVSNAILVIFTICIVLINCSDYASRAKKYQSIRTTNVLTNPNRLAGFNGHFNRYLPLSQIAQLAVSNRDSTDIIIVDRRHLANHLMLNSEIKPVIFKYLDKSDSILRKKYYLSDLSMRFYKPDYSSEEILESIDEGRKVYLLTNKLITSNKIERHWEVELEMIARFGFQGFKLYRLSVPIN